ncbi:AMP-binding protein [Actinomadura sp. 9N407]|uniref:AMP-binding protein n=1 Tax=Actinomadura sp. 9N407 TaxID=3375154 RepID=UPI00379E8273
MLLRAAEEHGEKSLVRFDDAERSFTGMCTVARQTATALAEAGIGRGDRVVVMADNRVEILDLIVGCAWLGAVAVPVNSALRGEALRHQVLRCEPRLVIVDVTTDRVLKDAVGENRPETCVLGSSGGEGLAERLGTSDLLDGSIAGACDPTASRPGDIAAILFTSGTTGPAKGVECPHAQFLAWGRNVGDQLRLSASEVLYTCLPLFHVNAIGTFFQALHHGATMLVGPKFSASRLGERLTEADATVTYLLGAMVNMVLAKPETPSDRTHRVTRALAPGTGPESARQFRERFGIELIDSYGSTETNAVIGSEPGGTRPGWIGPCRAGFEARVVDEDDIPVPDGESGELVLRATEPFAFAAGYFKEPAKTVAARRNLWLHTGDQVVRSEDGWFRFVDRMGDSIRRRGENISSHDVEQAIGSHPGVSQVAAYALPSSLGEDEVAVAVVVEPGHELAAHDVVAWCRERLAAFAVPRFVRVMDALPLTPQGKVRKQVLRDQGTTAAWDRETGAVAERTVQA